VGEGKSCELAWDKHGAFNVHMRIDEARHDDLPGWEFTRGDAGNATILNRYLPGKLGPRDYIND
jgi:hypothetical protein